MPDKRKVIGLVGSHSTGKTYIANELEMYEKGNITIIRENMDKILEKFNYTNVNQVKNEDWALIEDLILVYHYGALNQAIEGGKSVIICDRTIFDIATYTIYYNEFIPDVFISRILWYCKNIAPYTDIVLFPISHIKPQEDGFRKLKGRESIEVILRGILNMSSIPYIEATSSLPDRRSQLYDIIYK